MQRPGYLWEVLILSGCFGPAPVGASGLQAATVAHIVGQLNTHFALGLNVLVNMPSGDDAFSSLLHNTQTAKLIVDQPHAVEQIHCKFDVKLLAVVFVEMDTACDAMSLLVRLLWQLQATDVLFVYRAASDDNALLQLFTQCWQNGFINVLALVANGTLHTYRPFPTLYTVQLAQLDMYYDKQHLRNFQRYTLRSPVTNNSPRSYHFRNHQGQLVNAGYFYRMVTTFIRHHNGTFEELAMPTYAMNVNDTIAAFAAKQIDVFASLLYLDPRYSHSVVIHNLKVYIMVPYARELPRSRYFVESLSFGLWLVVVLTTGYAVALLSFAHWLQVQELDCSGAFLLVVNAILFLPGVSCVRKGSRLQKSVAMILVSMGFLLTNAYVTDLASSLISRLYEPQVNSIEDVARTRLLLPQTTVDTAYLRRMSGVPQIIYERLYHMTPDVVHNLRRDLNTSYMHSGVEDKVQFFLYQQKFLRVPYFKKIDEVLFQQPFFLAVPHGSPFLPLLNVYLRRIFDTGILQKMMEDCAEEGILSGEIKFFRTQSNYFNPLSLAHFTFMFAAWALGLLAAAVCFAYERVKSKVFSTEVITMQTRLCVRKLKK